VDRASSDAVAVAAAAMARTKSQGKADAISGVVAAHQLQLMQFVHTLKRCFQIFIMQGSYLSIMHAGQHPCAPGQVSVVQTSCQTNEVLYCPQPDQ